MAVVRLDIFSISSNEKDPKKVSMAKSLCKICNKPIGYDVEVVNDPDVEGLVHLVCLEGPKSPRI